MTRKPRKEIPVADYLKLQGRFRHLTDDQVNEIQEMVNFNWQRLLWLEESTHEMKEKYGRATMSVPVG